MRDLTIIIVTFVAFSLLIIALIQHTIIQNAINKRGEIMIGSPTDWDYTKIFQGLYITQQGMTGK